MKNILVFPCGSEIGLEIHRSLKYSIHFKLFGASSVNDHGRYIYENYIDQLPFCHDDNFVKALKQIILTYKIDAIYPTMDAVSTVLKHHEHELGCLVIGSSVKTNTICESKLETYQALSGHIPLPRWAIAIDQVERYPIFIKPIKGYGSRNSFYAHNQESALSLLNNFNQIAFIFCEYLPGQEYTVDCFSDQHGKLLFVGSRIRMRISNGISVNTVEDHDHTALFEQYATTINTLLKPRGAWFFQVKKDHTGQPKLLEVAARLGGSSSLFRAKGINFALLSLFDAFNIGIQIQQNAYNVSLDRALESKYKVDISYENIYVDLDDCLIINNKINYSLIGFLYKSIDEGKKIILVSKHAKNIHKTLKEYRIANIFDEIIHIDKTRQKYLYIQEKSSIFIDDSFAERQLVHKNLRIATFSPDMIEIFL